MAIVVAIASGWLAVRGIQARHHLASVQSAVVALRADLLSGNRGRARADLLAAQRGARAAHQETSDPLWSAAGSVPLVGAPVRTVSGVARVSDDLSQQVLPPLVQAGGVLTPGSLPYARGQVNLAALQGVTVPLSEADGRLRRQLASLNALPASTYLSPVDHGRAALVRDVGDLQSTVHAASLTAQLAPSMLGMNGPRNYFVAFQNNAEARGTGGIAGAFGILHADHGRISFPVLGSDQDLKSGLMPNVNLGKDYALRFGAAGGATVWQNANLSVNFPDAARVYMALWQAQTGQHLDGAFATDPVALSYLLRASGPASLPNGDVATAQNVVRLTESAVYQRFGDTQQRKDYLQQVSKATTDRVLSAPGGQAAGLLKALQQAAGQHRLLLFSGHPGEQAKLTPTAVSGALPAATRPTAILAVNNASGSKLDYYTKTSLDYRAAGSCSSAMRDVTVNIAITNGAPVTGLAPYAQHDSRVSLPAGTSLQVLSYYGTAGAQLVSASRAEKRIGVGLASEQGHPVFSLPVTLKPKQSAQITLKLREPVLHQAVATRPQPLVQPQRVTVHAPVC